MQPISTSLLERIVLSKTQFERTGLLLATDDGQVVGFAHAGFGPDATGMHLATERGALNMLMVRAADVQSYIGEELLARSERYVQERGAKSIYAGCTDEMNPFYFGLYGGSTCSGILTSDARMQDFYSSHGFAEVGRSVVLHVDLARFRPLVDRKQMQLRRRTSLRVVEDPAASTWWAACTYGNFTCTRFELDTRDAGGGVIAQATFWDMETFSTCWGVHASGLIDVSVVPAERRHGAATYLLAEAFRHLHSQGTSLVEMQVPMSNEPAVGLAHKLTCVEVDEAVSYCKDLPR